jgi:AraC-like DNA-binding protein
VAHRLVLVALQQLTPSGPGAGALAAEELALAFLRRVLLGTQRAPSRRRTRSGHCRREACGRASSEYVMRVREIIARRYHERLTLRDIASEAGCSPYHLSRLVTARDGVPIYRSVLNLRLRDALERVLSTRDPLTAIALDTGFGSQSHFGDAFRREFGYPPGALRKAAAAPGGRAVARRARARIWQV